MARRTPPGSLRRRPGSRSERRTVLVFCEGERTEVDYVHALRSLPEVHRTTAITVDRQHGVPLVLVEAAMRRAEDTEVDEIWCLHDVEAPVPHPHLTEVAKRVRHTQGRIQVAASNPCFELWLLLHAQDQSSHMTTTSAVAAAQAVTGVSGKAVEAALLPRRHDAARRARALDLRHEQDGTPAPGNPSSGMHRFLAAVEPGRNTASPSPTP